MASAVTERRAVACSLRDLESTGQGDDEIEKGPGKNMG